MANIYLNADSRQLILKKKKKSEAEKVGRKKKTRTKYKIIKN